MKSIITLFIAATAITNQAFSQQEPAIPVGTLNVNSHMVRQGIPPMLSWNIQYPMVVEDVVDIDADDEITTKARLRVQVSVIGVGITDRYGREYRSKSYIHYSSSGWKHVFSGTGSEVNPTQIVDDRIVPPGETLRFAAKLDMDGRSYFYNDSSNIRVLKNGDLPPTNTVAYGDHQTTAEAYLRPYISDGRLALGPLDVIYAAEVTHTNETSSGFDLQDTIVLVRFTPAP